MELIKRLWKEEEGQGLVEYGLILALIAIAVIVVLGLIGDGLFAIFTRVQETLEGAS